mmetsp:Transcript_6898/g.10094  ORF Transcript_6898/g.10094 Transcript_6898/m.10094 type:complete len:317 (+) Transcript_6898:51-1001(+)
MEFEYDSRTGEAKHQVNQNLKEFSQPDINTLENATTFTPMKKLLNNSQFHQQIPLHHLTPIKTFSIEKNLADSPLLSPNTRRSLSTADEQSMKTLVHSLNGMFDQQRKINRMNVGLNCVNLIANFANVVRTQSLKNESELVKLELNESKELISSLETRVTNNEHTIDDLNNSVASLEDDVADQRSKLSSATTFYQKTLKDLSSKISQYRNLLDSHERTRFREDLGMDILIVLLSLYMASSKMVSLPLHLALSLVKLKRKKRRLVHLLARLGYTVVMILGFRSIAQNYGFHASVGSITSYGMTFLTFIFRKLFDVFF